MRPPLESGGLVTLSSTGEGRGDAMWLLDWSQTACPSAKFAGTPALGALGRCGRGLITPLADRSPAGANSQS